MKTCFVICPIGAEGTEVRRRSDSLLRHIISPVVTDLGFDKPARADLTGDHRFTIPDDISRRLLEADLVIADLTDCNPNVFYELGKRHAWGGKCIHLTQEVGTLPFDIKHFRVITYRVNDLDVAEAVRAQLREAIESLDAPDAAPRTVFSADDIIRCTGATVLVQRIDGARDHYDLARRAAVTPCSRMLLMQRSSSFVLGPERGWGEEEYFYNAVLRKLDEGAEFFHVVSLEGLEWHLARKESVFPKAKAALDKLTRKGPNVGIRCKDKLFYFKKISANVDIPDLKPDRQARTFLVEYPSGDAEGVLVADVGGRQSAFHLRGPEMTKFMQSCIDFYHKCDLLTWRDLDPIIQKLKERGEWGD